MSCQSAVLENGTVIHICRADGEWKPMPNRRRKRFWCFQCRKHLLHTRLILDPGPMSYYGPSFMWSCEQCNEEHVLFPGREWVYPDWW